MPEEIDSIKNELFVGREALEMLEKSGEYVFHGSPHKIEIFEPRQAHQFNKVTKENIPDGEPAIFAATEFEPTIFKALINKEITPVDNMYSGWYSREGKMHYYAIEAGVIGAQKDSTKAYVYVFKKSDFEPYRGMEYRSLVPAKPEMVIEVTGKDLPGDIEFVDPPKFG